MSGFLRLRADYFWKESIMSQSKNRLWPWIAAALITFVFGYQILCGFRSLRYLMQHVFIADYAFYYFEIAKNIAGYGWSTFDRVHSTSGAQLLWSGILSVIAVFISDKVLFLRSVYFLSAVLNAIAGILFYRMGRALHSQQAGALAALIWCGLVIRQHPTNMGTELPLHMVVILLIASVLFQLASSRNLPDRTIKTKVIILGILLSINFWTRIDSMFYSVVLLFSTGVFLHKSGKSPKVMVLPAVICIAAAASYWILCNYLSGTPIPISSLAKHYYASRFFYAADPWFFFRLHFQWVFENLGRVMFSMLAPYQLIGKYFGIIQGCLILLVVALFVAFLTFSFRKRLEDARSFQVSRSLLLFYVFAALHVTLVVMAVGKYSTTTLHYYGWLYATLCITTAISFCYLLSLIPFAGLRRLIAAAAILLFLYPNAWFIWTQASQEEEIYTNTLRMQTAEWIRRNLPQDARIGAWNAGVIGYFSDRTIINLDGMANDKSYLDFLRSGEPIANYLQKENIQYLCDTNTLDLSMRFGQKWNRSKSLRGIIPLEELNLRNGDQKTIVRVYEFKVEGFKSSKVKE
jgi:hypothetical protein